ncbi:hypothetical protein EMIHUDRAFT_43128, partial [Emiliania huxleyi CCMP1516]|uniref:Alcohol dehydrogenase-like N-terminal domain-containing protein n=2 Tax=Emiliania huxleyi TaxID=2903 RepID=A0A0D3JDB0_EMIH1
YPCVPGHEVGGVCVAVGPNVTKFKIGDKVGVGCMVDACLKCKACLAGEEQMCASFSTGTYGALDAHGRAEPYPKGGQTLGGYTQKMVVHERFAIKIPSSYPLEAAGPVMCAGVTMYDPLKKHLLKGAERVKEGTHVGIVGLGGLGLTGVKVAKLLGCKVTAISRAEKGTPKAKIALESGADETLCSKSAAAMAAAAGTLDLIINTIPMVHDDELYEPLLTDGAVQVVLGVTPRWVAGLVGALTGALPARKTVSSGIGGIAATQEVVDLFDKHRIYPNIEIHPVEEINEIMNKLDKGNDSSVRYVLDMATLNE